MQKAARKIVPGGFLLPNYRTDVLYSVKVQKMPKKGPFSGAKINILLLQNRILKAIM